MSEPVDIVAAGREAVERIVCYDALSMQWNGRRDSDIVSDLCDEVERLRLVAADGSCEPKFHSFDDCFVDDSHPLAYESQYCQVCMTMCHAGNNETMTAWFETNRGAVCMLCFYDAFMAKSDKFFDTLSLKADAEPIQSRWVQQ